MLHGFLLPVRHVVNTIPAWTFRRVPDFSNLSASESVALYTHIAHFFTQISTLFLKALY
jgi:hypothetical protein